MGIHSYVTLSIYNIIHGWIHHGLGWIHHGLGWIHHGHGWIHHGLGWIHHGHGWIHHVLGWIHHGLGWIHHGLGWIHHGHGWIHHVLGWIHHGLGWIHHGLGWIRHGLGWIRHGHQTGCILLCVPKLLVVENRSQGPQQDRQKLPTKSKKGKKNYLEIKHKKYAQENHVKIYRRNAYQYGIKAMTLHF